MSDLTLPPPCLSSCLFYCLFLSSSSPLSSFSHLPSSLFTWKSLPSFHSLPPLPLSLPLLQSTTALLTRIQHTSHLISSLKSPLNLGGSLQDLVKMGGCQNPLVIQNISRQMLLGVNFLHSLRLIHRDLKPSNALISSSGEQIVCVEVC